jgi:hypothetical protein
VTRPGAVGRVGVLGRVGVVAGLAALSACSTAQLPTPAGVHTVRAAGGEVPREDIVLRKIPVGPAAGASAETIVRGWVAAATQPDVAQRFLAPGVTWDATASTAVTQDVPNVLVQPDSGGGLARLTVRAEVLADLDLGGALIPARRSVSSSLQLRLVVGQWRITALPPGVLVPAREVRIGRCPLALAWLSPDRRTAVRDEVLLPRCDPGDRGAVADAAVRALLAGPPPRLAGLVVGAVPAGTALAGPVRVVQDGGSGVAVVDLDSSAGDLPGAALSLLRQQVELSLGPITGIDRVRLLVDGQDRPVVDRELLVDPLDLSARAGQTLTGKDAVVLAAEPTGRTVVRLRRVDQRQVQPERGESAQPGQLPTSWAALASPDLWGDLSISPDGTVWLVRAGALWSLVPGGKPQLVPAPGGVGVLRLRVSRDGVHAVLLTAQKRLLPVLVRQGNPVELVAAGAAVAGISEVSQLSVPDTQGRLTVTGAVAGRVGLWRVQLAPTVDDVVAGTITPTPEAMPAPCGTDAIASISVVVEAPALVWCRRGREAGDVRELVRESWRVVAPGGPRIYLGG